MRLTAKVTIGEVVTEVTTKPVDILKWEAGSKRKITDGVGYGDLMQIIHSAAKREGLTELPFTDWAATLDDFDPVTPGADPTQTVPSTEG